jgi:hypothetical protein
MVSREPEHEAYTRRTLGITVKSENDTIQFTLEGKTLLSRENI